MVEQDSDFGHQHPRLTIRFEGELDLSRIDELDRTLTPVSSIYGMELIVDISAVTVLDSTAIDSLLCVREKLRQRRGSLRIVPADRELSLAAHTGLEGRIEFDLTALAKGQRLGPSTEPRPLTPLAPTSV
jgi:anti-anti-sigma factor